MTHHHVRFLACRGDAKLHELATHRAAAQRLASLLGCPLLDDEAPAPPGQHGYVVPNDTLTSLADAQRHGIRGEDDLFGGVVPRAWQATKLITHPRVDPAAPAPEGWSDAFAERVAPAVLPGFSTFTPQDARLAARRLLPEGPVRLKRADGIGGSGQQVVRDAAALEQALDAIEPQALAAGLVVEMDLSEACTFSVGRVRVAGLEAAYVGEQHTTLNRHGAATYGGSTLTVRRGGFEALADTTEDPLLRRAIEQARLYHHAALDCFAGMFASRCNYDLLLGHDAGGRLRLGVLEQSWRIGGASGAEIAALQAFAADPARQRVRASTVEAHGEGAPLPAGAILYYRGNDPHVGPITKYALLHEEDDDDALPRRTD